MLDCMSKTSSFSWEREYVDYFLARESLCLARYMLSPVRLSVLLSVCPSDRCIVEKRLKLGL